MKKLCMAAAAAVLALLPSFGTEVRAETVSAGISAPAPKPNKGEMRTIKKRMHRLFLPGKPSDAVVAELMKEIGTDGSFSDVDYSSEEFNSGGEKRKHLANLAKLARAYETPGGTYYKNRDLYNAIASALAYWVENNYEDPNWWHRIIGFPKDMMVTVVLLNDDMKRYDKELYRKCTDYLLYSWSVPKQRAQEGANGTDICKFTFAAAVITENETLLREVIEKVNSLVKIAAGDREEGIQPDYSFAQHNGSGRQLYLGTYGREYIDGVLYFMEFVAGTSFELAPEKVALFEEFFLEGVAWGWYKNEMDLNLCGRGLLRDNTGPSFVVLTQRLAALGTPRKEALEGVIAMMKGSRELNGNKMYWRMDYMVHRPKGAMVVSRMTSTRTVGNEAGNGEGLDNYHTGDGANYVKVHGNEYTPILAGWNWKRIPGTTVIEDTRKMPAPMWGEGGAGGSDFAGGVSDGRNGVCGFIYAKDSLEARKSWFYFDDYYVALGAGINSLRGDAPAKTTVNQTLLAGKVALADASGAASDLAGAGNTSPFSRLWHNDVGYRFEAGSVPAAEIYKSGKRDVLCISFDHGTGRQGGSYAYAVYPAVSRGDFFGRTGEDYRVLVNTPQVQAVQDVRTGRTMAVFYEAGSVQADGLGALSADKPCFLIAEGNGGAVKVTVADPYGEKRTQESVSVTVEGKSTAVPFRNGGSSAQL